MARVNERFTLTPQDAAYLRRVGARTALGTLCRHFGVSPYTLRRAMAEAGIPPLSELRRRVTERKRRLVARLYGTVPGTELAARLRVRPGTVHHWASDMGLPHTPRVREYNARRQRETGRRLGTLYAERSQRRKPESWYTARYGIRFAPADGESGDGQALQKPVTKREGTGRTAWTDGEE